MVVVNFIIVYVAGVLGIYTYELYLNYKIGSFDLDGDGFFSSEESTAEYAKYNSKLIGDVGRAFFPITWLIFSFLHSAIFFIALIVINKYKRNKL